MSVSEIPLEVVPAYKITQHQVRSKDRAVVPAGRSRNGEQVTTQRTLLLHRTNQGCTSTSREQDAGRVTDPAGINF